MTLELDSLAKTVLDAPAGFVVQTISEIVKIPVRLDVIEQKLLSGTSYSRKVIVSANNFPILRALVRFDSQILPKNVLSEILQKMNGIGEILQKFDIVANRRSLSLIIDPDGKKITREYEIFCRGTTWFVITEEIRLDFLRACQNS